MCMNTSPDDVMCIVFGYSFYMSTQQPKEYLSVKECASYSGKSLSTIRKWIREGKLTTKKKKHRNSKVLVLRESLTVLLHPEVEPTVEGSGVATPNDDIEVVRLRQQIELLQATIDQLRLKSESDNQVISNQQQLISTQVTIAESRENENKRLHDELLLIKTAYQSLIETNNHLTTRINNLTTYLALPWWKKMGSTLLLEQKDDDK
mgnify:CR=1 FL=1